MSAERDEDEVFELGRELGIGAGPSDDSPGVARSSSGSFRVRFRVYGGSAAELQSEAFDRLEDFVGDEDAAVDFRIVEIDARPLVESFDGAIGSWRGDVEGELLIDREGFFR